MRLLVLSDTHLGAPTVHRMPAEVWTLADEADAILHAGDVCEAAVLATLTSARPCDAVLGNNDVALRRSSPMTCRWSSTASASRWSTTPDRRPVGQPG